MFILGCPDAVFVLGNAGRGLRLHAAVAVAGGATARTDVRVRALFARCRGCESVVVQHAIAQTEPALKWRLPQETFGKTS